MANRVDRVGRPWRVAAISAGTGRFTFCLMWAAAIAVWEPEFSSIESQGLVWILEWILKGLGFGLIGLGVGWMFWGAALLGARGLAAALHRLRAFHLAWFLFTGEVFGLLMGWIFFLAWDVGPDRWISPMVAGAVAGPAAAFASWFADRVYRA